MSDDDDAWSVCSEEASVVDFSVDGEADTTTEVTDQDFEDALDLLFERRGSTREEGLRKVFKVLCLTYSFELASESLVTLQEAIKKCLRGGSSEQKLAYKVAQCLSITLGSDQNHLYKELRKSALVHIKTHRNSAIRALAIQSLALTCFVSSSDDEDTVSLLTVLTDVLKSHTSVDATVMHATLCAWSLLSTTCSGSHVHDVLFPEFMPLCVDLLSFKSLHVKVSTGEALAVLLERLQEYDEEFDMYDYEHLADMDEVLNLLNELSVSNSRKRRKDERAKLRNMFKKIYNSILSKEAPTEQITVADTQIVFDSWQELVQVHFLRACLGSGFLVHFKFNPLLQEIFDVQIELDQVVEKLTSQEKVLQQALTTSYW